MEYKGNNYHHYQKIYRRQRMLSESRNAILYKEKLGALYEVQDYLTDRTVIGVLLGYPETKTLMIKVYFVPADICNNNVFDKIGTLEELEASGLIIDSFNIDNPDELIPMPNFMKLIRQANNLDGEKRTGYLVYDYDNGIPYIMYISGNDIKYDIIMTDTIRAPHVTRCDGIYYIDTKPISFSNDEDYKKPKKSKKKKEEDDFMKLVNAVKECLDKE